MLSIGKLAPGQQRYYLETVARGAEEYYTGAKESPGAWAGRSADRLGLWGEVDTDALRLVLESRDPKDGGAVDVGARRAEDPGVRRDVLRPEIGVLVVHVG